MADARFLELQEAIVALWRRDASRVSELWGLVGSKTTPIPKQIAFLPKKARLDFLTICGYGAPAEAFGSVIAAASKMKDAAAEKGGGRRYAAVGGAVMGGATAR